MIGLCSGIRMLLGMSYDKYLQYRRIRVSMPLLDETAQQCVIPRTHCADGPQDGMAHAPYLTRLAAHSCYGHRLPGRAGRRRTT